MAASETEVANLALSHIGSPNITSLTERDNESAREIRRVFPASRRYIASKHKWNCMTRRVVAAQISIGPVFGWEFQYQLPADYITMVSLNGNDAEQYSDYWDIEGRRLLTSADVANIRYIADVVNVTEWSAGFVQCVALHIAAQIATPIRQDDRKAAQLEARLEDRVLPDARKTDANERRRRPIDTTRGSQYLRSRYVSTND